MRKNRSFTQPETSLMTHRALIAERNLEEFVVQDIEKIEPGLKIVERQLSTDAGTLDLLCQDHLARIIHKFCARLQRGWHIRQRTGLS